VEHSPAAHRTRRDAAFTAAIFGFFASAWFGWAQAKPPEWLVDWLVAGSIAAVLTMVAGVVLGVRHRHDGSALNIQGASRRYGIIVGIEFVLAGVGAGVLGATGAVDYIPVWICAVVGAHFLPLAQVLLARWLYPFGAALCGVAVAGLVVGLTGVTAPTTVVGVGAGLLLLTYGIGSLLAKAPAMQ
jgi:hypothetical protein